MLAARHRVPASYKFREFASAGPDELRNRRTAPIVRPRCAGCFCPIAAHEGRAFASSHQREVLLADEVAHRLCDRAPVPLWDCASDISLASAMPDARYRPSGIWPTILVQCAAACRIRTSATGWWPSSTVCSPPFRPHLGAGISDSRLTANAKPSLKIVS
jgi:hypothetical protein